MMITSALTGKESCPRIALVMANLTDKNLIG